LPREGLLDSWKAVAGYLGYSVRTCQRLEREAGLPIHRLDGSPKARVFAYPEEIERWLEKTSRHRSKSFWRRAGPWIAAGAAVLIAGSYLAYRGGVFGRGPRPEPPVPPRPVVEESGIPFLDEARAAERAYTTECDPKDLQRAIRLYEQAVEARPDSAVARYGLGSCYQNDYLSNGRSLASYAAMNTAYREALRLAPDLPEAHLGMGWSRLLSGFRDEAYVFFVKARGLAPSSALVNYQIGAFLGHIGLVDKAVVYLSQAINLGERSARAFRMRAFFELRNGQFGGAASDTARLCEMNPTNAKMFSAHARALLMLKDFDGAARELEVARVLSPADRDVILVQALLQAAGGEAGKALETVRELKADSPSPSPDVARVYALLGLAEETVGEIRAGIELERRLFQRQAFAYSDLSDPRNFVYDKVRGHPGFRAVVADLKAEYDDLLKRYAGL
jgi:tetratricopeptide (TPR) repeat protein